MKTLKLVLYVTHDRAEASNIGVRIVCMRHGHVERTVSVEEFKAARQSSL
jgi:ABC-type sugar transport system ATPase subunit